MAEEISHSGVFLLHFLTMFVINLFFILHFVSNEVQELNASLSSHQTTVNRKMQRIQDNDPERARNCISLLSPQSVPISLFVAQQATTSEAQILFVKSLQRLLKYVFVPF